jgi:hypothetical protein
MPLYRQPYRKGTGFPRLLDGGQLSIAILFCLFGQYVAFGSVSLTYLLWHDRAGFDGPPAADRRSVAIQTRHGSLSNEPPSDALSVRMQEVTPEYELMAPTRRWRPSNRLVQARSLDAPNGNLFACSISPARPP